MREIQSCPTCGGKRLLRVRRDLVREYKGQSYEVPDLEFEECPDCGEKLFDREAMRRIESCSPAFSKTNA